MTWTLWLSSHQFCRHSTILFTCGYIEPLAMLLIWTRSGSFLVECFLPRNPAGLFMLV
ncbi:hypothetical protein NC652_007295 [Populus alba x Populus x berolinensis]|nr:hypothetical protein NC652_007295 [Populus alba x Populus x berolinensis]